MSNDKLYRIGEAATLLNLKSYVLRFWETEFPQIEPVRTDKGQRLYTERHIGLLKTIKKLLHEDGLTIDGARRILDARAGTDPDQKKIAPSQELLSVYANDEKKRSPSDAEASHFLRFEDESSLPQKSADYLELTLANYTDSSLSSKPAIDNELLDEIIDELEQILSLLQK